MHLTHVCSFYIDGLTCNQANANGNNELLTTAFNLGPNKTYS
jgi:hypothetical protein